MVYGILLKFWIKGLWCNVFYIVVWYLVYLIIVNLIEVVEILVIRKLFLLILISIDYKYFVIFGEDKCNRMLY